MKRLIILIVLMVSISLALPLFEDFNDGDYSGWEVYDRAPYAGGPSNWIVTSGVLTQTSNIYTTLDEYDVYTGTRLITGELSWENYSFNVELKSTDDDGVGLLFRYQDEDNYYRYLRVEDEYNGGPFRRIEKCVDGAFELLVEDTSPISYPPNFFCLTVWVNEDSIQVFEEGELVLSTEDSDYSSGKVGFMCYANSGSYFDNVAVVPEFAVDSAASGIKAGPYVQNPDYSAITIMWETLNETTSKIFWGTSMSFTDSIESPLGNMHEVRIDGLSLDTKYYYAIRVDSDFLSGEEYYFHTKPGDATPYRMGIWGDNRTDYFSHEHIINAMIAKEPRLAVNVGDIVTSGSVYDQYISEYFWPARNLLKNTASFISIGNHENDAAWFDYYVDQPNNEHWFALRYGPAYLIFVDTNRWYTPFTEQYEWLENELSSTEAQDAPWLLVFHHHPPYSEGWDSPGYDGEEDVRDYLVPLYEEYNVDICFAGHTHDYERGEKDGVAYVISGGGGSALDSWQQDWEYMWIYHSIYQHVILDIAEEYIIYKCFDWDNNLVDSTLFGFYLDIVSEENIEPGDMELISIAPNPFNSCTEIVYRVEEDSYVSVDVFDANGRFVTKVANGFMQAGLYSAWWEAERSNIPSGTYFIRTKQNGEIHEEKVTLIR